MPVLGMSIGFACDENERWGGRATESDCARLSFRDSTSRILVRLSSKPCSCLRTASFSCASAKTKSSGGGKCEERPGVEGPKVQSEVTSQAQ